MQDTEGKPIKLNGKPTEFTAKGFTATNFATAEDKAKWANKFTKFILGGFQRNAFKKETYKQLQHMFGHCAEYDLDGFYYTWFEDTHKCLLWVETVTTTWLAGIGQPQFTWSDVEIKLVKWIRENNIHDQVAGYLHAETEQKERATLKILLDRYGVVPISNAAETGELTADPTPVQIEIPAPVQELGQLKLF
jgi:uncharacterized protein YbgA (DUF1722 family)